MARSAPELPAPIASVRVSVALPRAAFAGGQVQTVLALLQRNLNVLAVTARILFAINFTYSDVPAQHGSDTF